MGSFSFGLAFSLSFFSSPSICASRALIVSWSSLPVAFVCDEMGYDFVFASLGAGTGYDFVFSTISFWLSGSSTSIWTYRSALASNLSSSFLLAEDICTSTSGTVYTLKSFSCSFSACYPSRSSCMARAYSSSSCCLATFWARFSACFSVRLIFPRSSHLISVFSMTSSFFGIGSDLLMPGS